MVSPFKNASGTRITKGLFFETADSKENVFYTLKREDHLGFVSLYRLYMEAADPTEYKFAVSHLDGWGHWEILRDCSWFKPHLIEWRSELTAKLESDQYHRIEAIAAAGSENARFVANRYLLDRTEKATGAKKRGRPTKVALQEEIARTASLSRKIDDDYSRVLGKAN